MDDGYYDDDAAEAHAVPSPPCFILAPLNPAARRAVDHASNSHLRYRIDDTIGLWLDFSNPEKQACTLGKGEDADIHLPDTRSSSKGSPHISGVHASFQVVHETGAVLLWNCSDNGTVEPLPHSHCFTVKFRPNAQSVLVARGINSRIAFGKDQWYQFEIQWQSDGMYRFLKDEPYTMGPRNSRTKKYVLGGEVGAGSYGTVSWVLDATSGKIIAVKKFHRLSGKNLEFATREIANLFRINRDDSIKHEHILQILDCAGGGKGDDWGEIFMPLMDGNLKTLVERVGVPDELALSDTVLRQMLLALQCIAEHNIIHRDVKPENILWEYDAAGRYRFCLGDFGLSNDPALARTAAGTEPFMAPEVFHRQQQTTKVDIWSLFATVVWTRTPEFRHSCSQLRAPELHAWLVQFSKMDLYADIRRMASMEPRKRPSAARQLDILDGQLEGGVGGYGGSTSGDELGDDLGARFSSAMHLQDGDTPGLTYGSGSSEAITAPELPYYEPYASGLLETYFGDQAGPSKRYVPPSPDLADAPRDHTVGSCSSSLPPPLPLLCYMHRLCC
jgi:serine/threonine protein kinase